MALSGSFKASLERRFAYSKAVIPGVTKPSSTDTIGIFRAEVTDVDRLPAGVGVSRGLVGQIVDPPQKRRRMSAESSSIV